MLSGEGSQHKDSPLASASPVSESAIQSGAKGLKRQHDQLVLKLRIGGGVGTLVLFVLLLAIADGMGRAPGGGFVFLLGLLGAVGFVALLVPRCGEGFARRMPAPKDPLTGRPLQMLWWWRWFAGAITVLLLIALSDYGSPPAGSPTEGPGVAGGSPAPVAEASPAAKVSRDVELEEARKFFCAWSEYYSALGEPLTEDERAIFLGPVHLEEFFHVSDEEALGVANEVAKEAAGSTLNCAEVLKRNPLVPEWPKYEPGDHTEALRAAAIFCREWYSLLEPGETVERAKWPFSPMPCNFDEGRLGYCPNGSNSEASGAIAEKFKIPWQQANADIVAGLGTFDPKGLIADACSQLGKQYPADAALGPDDWSTETELLRDFCANVADPSARVSDLLHRTTTVVNDILYYNTKAPPDETMADFCRRKDTEPFPEPELLSFCTSIDRDPKAAQSFTSYGYAKDLDRLTKVIYRRGSAKSDAATFQTMTLADFCRNEGF